MLLAVTDDACNDLRHVYGELSQINLLEPEFYI